MQYQKQIAEVYQRIAPYIRNTPVLPSVYFSQKTNSTIFLKCENFQYPNSFKVRGAFNKLTQIPDKKNKIALAASAGNHGIAVAFAAHTFGMKAIIVVPKFVPECRINTMKMFGAEVIVYGNSMEDLNAKIIEYTQDPNYIFIHPFDDDDVIAGQATVAYELLKQVPDIDVIVVPVGGGGLISGISQYAKSINPNIIIYGAQTIGADAMAKSLQANKIISLPAITSIAISLGVTRVAERTFEIVKKNVDQVVAVSDAEAIRDLKDILDNDKLLVEPASSCTLSALISEQLPSIKGKKVAAIMSGGSIPLSQLKEFL